MAKRKKDPGPYAHIRRRLELIELELRNHLSAHDAQAAEIAELREEMAQLRGAIAFARWAVPVIISIVFIIVTRLL